MAKPDQQVDTLKVPPHSIEAEQSVLGGLMLDNQAFDRVAELVVAQDFYTRTHKLIFEAMTKLVEASQPIDLITISENLEKNNQLDTVGGFAYLAEIAKNTPSAANIDAYASIVRERAVVREMISVANEIARRVLTRKGVIATNCWTWRKVRYSKSLSSALRVPKVRRAFTAFSKKPSIKLKSFTSRRRMV